MQPSDNIIIGLFASLVTAALIIYAGIFIRKLAKKPLSFYAIIPLCLLMLFLANVGAAAIGSARLGFIDIIAIVIFGKVLRRKETPREP